MNQKNSSEAAYNNIVEHDVIFVDLTHILC